MTARVYKSIVGGRRGRGHPRKEWRKGVNKVLCARGLDMQQAHVSMLNTNEWRQMVFGT